MTKTGQKVKAKAGAVRRNIEPDVKTRGRQVGYSPTEERNKIEHRMMVQKNTPPLLHYGLFVYK